MTKTYRLDGAKPIYVHDCDCCLFLASFGGVDHYVCHGPPEHRFPDLIKLGVSDLDAEVLPLACGCENVASSEIELIRRSSSDGPDYTSIPATLVRSLPDSIAAKKYGITLELAQAAGVL
jgi:hypothetical protein